MQIGPLQSTRHGVWFIFTEDTGKDYRVTLPNALLRLLKIRNKDLISKEMWVANNMGQLVRTIRLKIEGHGTYLRPYDLVEVKEQHDAD